MPVRVIISLTAAMLVVMFSSSAEAYIGPGAGLSAIGTIVALIGAVFLVIAGFVWYPIKRILRKRTRTRPKAKESDQTDQS